MTKGKVQHGFLVFLKYILQYFTIFYLISALNIAFYLFVKQPCISKSMETIE